MYTLSNYVYMGEDTIEFQEDILIVLGSIIYGNRG